MTERTLDVDGLHCEGCVDTVRETLLALDGVDAVEVTLQASAPSVVTIQADGDVDLDLLQRALAQRGDFTIRR